MLYRLQVGLHRDWHTWWTGWMLLGETPRRTQSTNRSHHILEFLESWPKLWNFLTEQVSKSRANAYSDIMRILFKLAEGPGIQWLVDDITKLPSWWHSNDSSSWQYDPRSTIVWRGSLILLPSLSSDLRVLFSDLNGSKFQDSQMRNPDLGSEKVTVGLAALPELFLYFSYFLPFTNLP